MAIPYPWGWFSGFRGTSVMFGIVLYVFYHQVTEFGAKTCKMERVISKNIILETNKFK